MHHGHGAVKELFNVLTPGDAFARLAPYLHGPRATERVRTEQALGRVLAEDLRSPGSLPTFRRSTMDGFAVRAADTFGASEGLPAYLTVIGEVLMGRPVAPGEHVIQVGEDVEAGDLLLTAGHTVRPQDIGGLLALGIVDVTVAPR